MRQPPHSFAERFVRGNILERAWTLAASGLSLANSLFILAVLSVYEFGLYQLVLSAAALGSVFSVNIFDAVVGTEIARRMAAGRLDEAKRLFLEFAGFKVGAGALIAAALFFGAGLVARVYGADIAGYIRILSLLFLLRAASSVGGQFLYAVASLRGFGAGMVEEGTRLALVAGLWLFTGLGIREVLIATLAASAAALLYIAVPFLREARRFFGRTPAARRLLGWEILRSYGFWLLIRSAIAKASEPLRPWLIRTFLSTEAVALYAVAANFATILKKSLFPQLSPALLAWEVENPERLRYIFARSMKYSLWYGALLAIGAAIAGSAFISIFFPKYLPALPFFLVFLLAVPFHGMGKVVYNLLTALREQRLLALRRFTEIVLNTVLSVIFLPVIGLYAVVAVATGTVIWRTAFLSWRLIRRYPFLRLSARSLFWFDAEDIVIFRRALREARTMFRRLAPGRS